MNELRNLEDKFIALNINEANYWYNLAGDEAPIMVTESESQ